jgi:hypothetical protein
MATTRSALIITALCATAGSAAAFSPAYTSPTLSSPSAMDPRIHRSMPRARTVAAAAIRMGGAPSKHTVTMPSFPHDFASLSTLLSRHCSVLATNLPGQVWPHSSRNRSDSLRGIRSKPGSNHVPSPRTGAATHISATTSTGPQLEMTQRCPPQLSVAKAVVQASGGNSVKAAIVTAATSLTGVAAGLPAALAISLVASSVGFVSAVYFVGYGCRAAPLQLVFPSCIPLLCLPNHRHSTP